MERKNNVFQEDSIVKSILTMAVPTVISQMISIVYNYADTIFIGRLGDPEQSAAIALALPLTLLMTALANFWGIGGGSTVSRALGRGDEDEAQRAAAFALYGALLTGVLCAAAAFAMGDAFPFLLGASPADLIFTRQYVFWFFIVGLVPSVLSQVLAHFARALGLARQAGLGLTLGGVLNILLDPVFIFSFGPFGLGMGVAGAALATMLSNVASLAYFLVLFLGHGRLRFRPRDAVPVRRVAAPVLSVGLPSALIPFLSGISNGVLNNLISTHGDVTVAAIGIAKKMDMLPANLGLGITQGALPLLAYSYGAGETARTRKLLTTTAWIAFGSTACLVVFLEIFATPLAHLFINDAETVFYATQFIRRLCLSIPFYATTLTVNTFFQAVNRPGYALGISVLRKGTFDLPLMVLFNALFPVAAIIWVQPLMDVIATAVTLMVLAHFFRVQKKAALNG